MPTDRQSPRLPFMWPVRYEQTGGAQHRGVALCLNIGVRGMLLLLDRTAREGDTLTLQIKDMNRAAPTRAEVRWTRPGKLKSTVLAGVEYLD